MRRKPKIISQKFNPDLLVSWGLWGITPKFYTCMVLSVSQNWLKFLGDTKLGVEFGDFAAILQIIQELKKILSIGEVR